MLNLTGRQRWRRVAAMNLPAEENRAARLRKKHTNVGVGIVLDLVFAIVIPGGIGCLVAFSAVMIIEHVDGSSEWITDNIYSPQVTSALGTLIAFLVALRLGSNLTRNAALINHFGNLCGACVNMAIWSRSLVSDASLNYKNYVDIRGIEYKQTDVGLILASVPYVVKFTYRGVKILHTKLPLAADETLKSRMGQLIEENSGFASVSPFIALVMMLGEHFDSMEAEKKIKPAELGALLGHLNALTGEEGAIGGMSEYSPPMILDILLYIVFIMYYILLIFSDLGPSAQWNSLWIVAVLIVANFGVFVVSNRYSNPFRVRSGQSTQKAFISLGAQGTERAIEGIFSRSGRLSDMPPKDYPIMTTPETQLDKLRRSISRGV